MDIASLHNLSDRDILIHIATNVAALRDISVDHETRLRGVETEQTRMKKADEDRSNDTKKHLAMGAIAATLGVKAIDWVQHLISGR